jgi:hypothetical protein
MGTVLYLQIYLTTFQASFQPQVEDRTAGINVWLPTNLFNNLPSPSFQPQVEERVAA